ncbi:probable ubiquitin-like-specific protease 2A isoform X2 [Dioscorea cayenensis subsp. rotundata]|nr:probable ubiquitin-like-specific protease 2A isoform X2 [Dioscorea cayenensis subsp. rotundata]XP_039117555.1 probable ubiquitin-like-specific protease 2A isoform X2 [Dioscorea cayenensis subsp. rotundata]XP_039117556.1 probable ubiquitin-like-specific protease 2A isoform X2 [Dioscorea cayenensis subsp. rotundata]XP_039117558.1 probable ubiquitin-like-specific protease 2A isoform X2 [Dioscorea cayenensis subsp. rotundata]XP_039117559.1 probable ubiquitin-like-specific protease 2A isoform X2 
MAEEQSSNSGVHLSSIGSVPQNSHPQRLQSDRALHSDNENMIDTDQFEYYLEHLWENITEEKRSSFACLDSLWFYMYKRAVTKEKVLKWIKKKKIFKRKYVFIPIVCWGHWSLLILCNFGENRQPDTEKPCMLLLDSLHKADPKRLEPDIRRFVLDICRTEAGDEMKEDIYKIPLLVPKVPQQRNGVDCGIFVLYYLHLFAQNAPAIFTLDGYPYFLKEDWFSPDDLESFRKEIYSFECKFGIIYLLFFTCICHFDAAENKRINRSSLLKLINVSDQSILRTFHH